MPKPITMLAGAAGAITSTYIGSRFGDTGTLWGVGLGSVISASSAAAYESLVHKVRGVPTWRLPDWQWASHIFTPKFAAIASAAIVGTSGTMYGAVSFVEWQTGRTIHSFTTGKPDYGTSIGGSTTKSPAPEPSSPEPSTTTEVPSLSPSVAPTPTITTPSATVSAVPTPTQTPSDTISVSPSVSPTDSPVPTPTGTGQ